MELHRPHEQSPFRSWRAFVVEIATIVVGVLIALSFEGVREWNHNRSLANVDGELSGFADCRRRLDAALRFANEAIAQKLAGEHSLQVGVDHADLHSAGWETAERTGALAHMSYSEVQRFADVYALQSLYQAQQRRDLDDMVEILAIISSGDPTQAPRSDMERFREHLLTVIARLTMEEQLGRQLATRYGTALQ